MTKETGGNAFPQTFDKTEKDGRVATITRYGMTLRDYFAAKAMQGELACQCVGQSWLDIEKLAEHCYNIADAMLKARDL